VTNYARAGRAVEHAARHLLDDAGYWTQRSAASKGAVDIIALKHGQILFVQCKRSGALPPAEWNALYGLAMELGAVPVLAQIRLAPRRVVLHRLTAPKDGSRRQQPMEEFVIDEPAAVTP
jgi:Holliday junction resolvase